MKVEIISHVTDGKISRNRKLLSGTIRQYEGKDIVISVERKIKKRTNLQNRYMHSAMTILTKELNALGNNFTMGEVKDLLKVKFLLIDVTNNETGEVYGQRVKGTSECSTTELNEFIESIRKWAMDVFGIYLPEPNEQLTVV